MRAAHRTYDHSKPVQGQQIAPVLRATAPDLDQVMRPVDQRAFAYTAWWFDVYIIVRRSNAESIKYIGQPGFVPKGPETKVKTAQLDFRNPETGKTLKVAGLVVNPRAPGMRGAFRTDRKHASALKYWDEFAAAARLYTVETGKDGKPTKTILKESFFVDLNPASERFGALKFSRDKMVANAGYIHGDYDLFAIVPADNPSVNIAVAEQHLSSPWHPLNRRPGMDARQQKAQEILNFRGREPTDVQNMLNRLMGVTMILHGDQEKAVSSFDEEVDVFFPDGERSCYLDGPSLRNFYEGQLQGRQLFDFMGGGRRTGTPIPGALAADRLSRPPAGRSVAPRPPVPGPGLTASFPAASTVRGREDAPWRSPAASSSSPGPRAASAGRWPRRSPGPVPGSSSPPT